MSKDATEAEVAAPIAEAILAEGGSHPLAGINGLVIKQDKQLLECILQECLGLYCIEYDNRYEIAPTSDGTAFIQSRGGTGFKPSMEDINRMTKTLKNTESSDMIKKCLLMWCGCGQCRPFEMNLTPPTNPGQSFVKMEREFALGGMFCCPHEATIFTNGQPIARVVEDWNCANWCCRLCAAYWCCKVPYIVQLSQGGNFVNRYRVNVNFCCCGPHTNCCGSTIFCNDMLWDFAEYGPNGSVNTGNIGGRLQKTYGGCCSAEAFFRWTFCKADNYIINWNDSTTVEERAAMLGTATLLDYVFFERLGSTQSYLAILIANAC